MPQRKPRSERFRHILDEIDGDCAAPDTGGRSALPAPHDKTDQDRLHAMFWDKVDEEVYTAVACSGRDGLEVTDAEADLLDFGAWSPLRLHMPADLRARFVAYRVEARTHGLRLLSEFLVERHRYYRAGSAIGRSPAMEESLHRLEEYLISLKGKRTRLLEKRLPRAERTRMEAVNQALETSLKEGLSLQMRAQARRDTTVRNRIFDLKDEYDRAQKVRSTLLQDLNDPRQMEVLNRKIEECYKQLFRLKEALAESHALFESVEATPEVSREDIHSGMEDEVRILRSFVQMSAAGTGKRPFSPLLEPDSLPNPEALRAAVVAEAKAQELATEQLPPLLLVPSNGSGTYDWNQNLMLVPTQPCAALAAVARNVVTGYRMHISHATARR